MRMIFSLFLALGGLTALLPQQATAREWDVWGLQAYSDVCQISFDGNRTIAPGIGAVVQHSQGCRGGGLGGFSSENGGNTILLYSVGGTTLIGRFDRAPDGSYDGIIDDGEPARLFFMGRMQIDAQPVPQVLPPAPNTPAGQGCLVYYDSRLCARPEDVGAPRLTAGPGALQTLTTMNVRFLPGANSSIIGKLQVGTCIETTNCREAPFNGGLWCEVRLDFRTGWILKQDDEFVYSRNGCG